MAAQFDNFLHWFQCTSLPISSLPYEHVLISFDCIMEVSLHRYRILQSNYYENNFAVHVYICIHNGFQYISAFCLVVIHGWQVGMRVIMSVLHASRGLSLVYCRQSISRVICPYNPEKAPPSSPCLNKRRTRQGKSPWRQVSSVHCRGSHSCH